MPRPFTWLDVFTQTPMTGNPLVVVHEADGLDEAAMLAFARETRMSETTFVQAATVAGADYRNRIFDSRGELSLAGHPTLGTAVAVAQRRGEASASYVQQTPSGLQPIDVQFHDGGRVARASTLQEPAIHGRLADTCEVFAAAGLLVADADPDLPALEMSTGYRHLVAIVRDETVLERCAPRLELLAPLLDRHGCGVLTLAALGPVAGTARVRAFFAAFGAVTEDPATGSAAGALCAYLERRCGWQGVSIEQGVAMGRPSRIEAEMAGDRVRVAGDVVILATGQLSL